IHPSHVEARPSRCSAHPTAPAAEPMHPAVVDPLPKHPYQPAASNRMQFRYRIGGPNPHRPVRRSHHHPPPRSRIPIETYVCVIQHPHERSINCRSCLIKPHTRGVDSRLPYSHPVTNVQPIRRVSTTVPYIPPSRLQN